MGERTSEQVQVSVVVTTYNHASYIGKCIDSIMAQTVNFKFELILGVDDGGDDTLKICRSYQERFPEIIQIIENRSDNVLVIKGRRVGRYNFLNALAHTKGKYVARCDGDDFWTNSSKLQMQFDYLESHPEAVAVHTWQEYGMQQENGLLTIEPAPKEGHGYYPAPYSDVRAIFENKLRIKTRTLMFRNIPNLIPDWFHKIAYGDVALSMILGKHGGFGFIDQPMAVYRITRKGASTVGSDAWDFNLKHFLEWIRIWEYGDAFFSGEYRNEVLRTIRYFYRVIFDRYNFDYTVYRRMSAYNRNESILPNFTKFRVGLWLFFKFTLGRFKRIFKK